MTIADQPIPLQGAPAPRKHASPARKRVLWFVFAALASLVLGVVLFWPRITYGRSVPQPDTVSYRDGARYSVFLVERGSLAAQALGRTDSELWLGIDHFYVHAIELEITGSSLDSFKVQWDADGARITFEKGHELFVPAGAFTGGR